MDYKEIMDLWFVWAIGIGIIFKYIKCVKDNWND